MKRNRLLPLLLLSLLLTGCNEESLSDRLYTRAIGLTQGTEITLYGQIFGSEDYLAAEGVTPEEALCQGEIAAGGRIFTGHTELLCLDGSCTLETVQSLFFSQDLSPACKLLYTPVESYFRTQDSTETVRCLRMAEQDGLLAEASLATVLNEWLGIWETALLPDEDGGMVLLHKNGTDTGLSESAVRGLCWLRQDCGELTTVIQLPEGVCNITIVRSSLKKTAEQSGNRLRYAITVYTQSANDEERSALKTEIQNQCRTAVTEMQAARADVIGMQELIEGAGAQPDPDNPPHIAIEVTVK
jgi:hypothetical protein